MGIHAAEEVVSARLPTNPLSKQVAVLGCKPQLEIPQHEGRPFEAEELLEAL